MIDVLGLTHHIKAVSMVVLIVNIGSVCTKQLRPRQMLLLVEVEGSPTKWNFFPILSFLSKNNIIRIQYVVARKM